jgi:hypothetical protein
MGGDDDHETASVLRIGSALQVVRLFEPGHKASHRGLADLLASGEVTHPQRAVSLNGGQRRDLRHRELGLRPLAQLPGQSEADVLKRGDLVRVDSGRLNGG